MPVIRYAEVLLNLAEARVTLTNTVDSQAVALLNAVRIRPNHTFELSLNQLCVDN